MIYFFLLVSLDIVQQLKKNILMKNLFEKVYDLVSHFLFGNESATHY